jgi:hypothetical protein
MFQNGWGIENDPPERTYYNRFLNELMTVYRNGGALKQGPYILDPECCRVNCASFPLRVKL